MRHSLFYIHIHTIHAYIPVVNDFVYYNLSRSQIVYPESPNTCQLEISEKQNKKNTLLILYDFYINFMTPAIDIDPETPSFKYA